MLKVGKLYSCSKYLLLYPDKETAAVRRSLRPSCPYTSAAAYWSRKLGKPVSYCDHLTPLLVLSVKEKYIEVLAEDKVGWIINEDWLNIKEIVNEAA